MKAENKLFTHQRFVDTWNTFNEYLQEDFGIIITEEEKETNLARIHQLSGGNPELACEILEILISRGETTILMPDPEDFE